MPALDALATSEIRFLPIFLEHAKLVETRFLAPPMGEP